MGALEWVVRVVVRAVLEHPALHLENLKLARVIIWITNIRISTTMKSHNLDLEHLALGLDHDHDHEGKPIAYNFEGRGSASVG